MIRLPTARADILHLHFETQREVASTFLRLQEFYESGYPEFQGHFFTLDTYAQRYAADRGGFTYYEDWAGFNVPGDVVVRFYQVFGGDLSIQEKALLETIVRELDRPLHTNEKFYVLGTCTGHEHAIDHELAHAFFYLDTDYAAQQRQNVQQLPNHLLEKVRQRMRQMGYAESVVNDECQAYLATSETSYLERHLKLTPEEFQELDVSPFVRTFETFKNAPRQLLLSVES